MKIVNRSGLSLTLMKWLVLVQSISGQLRILIESSHFQEFEVTISQSESSDNAAKWYWCDEVWSHWALSFLSLMNRWYHQFGVVVIVIQLHPYITRLISKSKKSQVNWYVIFKHNGLTLCFPPEKSSYPPTASPASHWHSYICHA